MEKRCSMARRSSFSDSVKDVEAAVFTYSFILHFNKVCITTDTASDYDFLSISIGMKFAYAFSRHFA
jgi:hypothetical protein